MVRAHACGVQRLVWYVSVGLHVPGSYLTAVYPLSGLPQALSSIQMILICVVTDVLPALSLVYEQPEADLLLRKPRDRKKDRLADVKLICHAYFFMGILESLAAMAGCVRSLTGYLIWFSSETALAGPSTSDSSAAAALNSLSYG